MGIVAEGPADVAETDAHQQPADRCSNFETVLAECRDQRKITTFLCAEVGEHRVVVHLDAAEAYRVTFDAEVPPGEGLPPERALHQRLLAGNPIEPTDGGERRDDE